MLQTSVIFLVGVVIVSNVESARILAYFPTPSRSHQVEIRALTHELARRGHEVVVVTPDPAFPRGEAPANLTEIDVHDISYKILEEILVVHNMRNNIDMAYRVLSFLKYFSMIVDTQLEVPEIKAILNKDRKHFDLLLLESMHRSILGLTHIFDCPVIQISFVGIAGFQYGDLGAASHPILYPTQERQRLYNLSFLEKSIEYFKQIAFHLVVKISQKEDYVVMQKHFGRDVPSVDELNRRVVMIFVNERKLWASNRPVPPNIQFIGGISLKTQKDLPEDLKNFLDSSKYGVIYVSFGTKVKTRILPEDKIISMINVFSKLPYDILWKWDEDELPTKSKNIKISKWFPQADLLKHPNVKLFIKQGGLQSTEEAIDAGVPVIGMPIYFGDEWYNVEKYAHFNIGLYLDIDTLTEEEFEKSIITILRNESYRNNVIKLRAQMMNQPVPPLDLAVWWTEHVIQHGGEHLQPPSAFMSYYDYYEVNMTIVFALILLAVTAVVFLVSRTVILCWVLRAGNVRLKSH